MVISFSVVDRETARPLNGVLYWEEYGEITAFPFRGGRIDVVSSGAYTGARRSFAVWADGYVPHYDYFFQYNGMSFDIGLSRYVYAPEFVSPEEPGEGSPLGKVIVALAAVLVVGGLVIKKK